MQCRPQHSERLPHILAIIWISRLALPFLAFSFARKIWRPCPVHVAPEFDAIPEQAFDMCSRSVPGLAFCRHVFLQYTSWIRSFCWLDMIFWSDITFIPFFVSISSSWRFTGPRKDGWNFRASPSFFAYPLGILLAKVRSQLQVLAYLGLSICS